MTTTSEPATARGRRFRRPPHRLALLASVCVLVLSTCATGLPAAQTPGVLMADPPLQPASQPVGEVSDRTLEDRKTTRLRTPSLPDDPDGPRQRVAVEPEPEDDAPEPEIVFDPVTVQRPKIRLEEPDGPVAGLLGDVLGSDGVRFATSVVVGDLRVHSDQGVATVSVAGVDPAAFRHFTPQVTADAVDVWRRIVEGDAAFTHDVGHRLELELGARVPVGDGDDTLRIGAYASNGVPPIADAIVSRATFVQLGIEGRRQFFVSVHDDVDPEQLAPRLAEELGVEANVIVEPPTRRAFMTGAAARDAFEPFTYVSIGDGMIQIDRDWVRRNIVSARVPIFRGNVICHRLLVPQLRGALQEVVDEGLDHLIDPTQYGGCWVPRHILFNPRRGLSMHAWGLAVDFNVKGNEYGNRNPEMDPRIVEIFEKWGFVWGGRWSTPDGMHFELGALLQRPPN